MKCSYTYNNVAANIYAVMNYLSRVRILLSNKLILCICALCYEGNTGRYEVSKNVFSFLQILYFMKCSHKCSNTNPSRVAPKFNLHLHYTGFV